MRWETESMMMLMIISMWKWGNDPQQLWWCPYFCCCCWWSSMPRWWSPSTVRHDDVHHCCGCEATTKLPKLTIRKEILWYRSFVSLFVTVVVVCGCCGECTSIWYRCQRKEGNKCCWLLSLLVFIPYSIRLIDASKNERNHPHIIIYI